MQRKIHSIIDAQIYAEDKAYIGKAASLFEYGLKAELDKNKDKATISREKAHLYLEWAKEFLDVKQNELSFYEKICGNDSRHDQLEHVMGQVFDYYLHARNVFFLTKGELEMDKFNVSQFYFWTKNATKVMGEMLNDLKDKATIMALNGELDA